MFVFNFCQVDYYVSLFLLGFILSGTLSFPDLVDNFLSHFREAFSYCLFKIFLQVLSLSLLLLDSYRCKWWCM